MRYLSFFTVALVLGLTFTFVALPSYPVQAATYYVDDDTCTDPGSGTEADPFCSIQSGIDAASSGDTVQVAAGTYYENITMKSGVVIQGAGQGVSTIEGGGNGSVVTAIGVDSAATLDGFTITGGVSDYGGGMYNENSSPTVTNCTFSENSASPWGGGMYNEESSPTVTNCTFSGNQASPFGFGGGMRNNGSSPTVTNCTFSGNSANYGGGMYSDNLSYPTVESCTFSENSAVSGGGMENGGDSSPAVTNCTFSGNSASQYGGGMYNYSGSPTVTNCTFSGNYADGGGGGMRNNLSASPTVTNCTFSGNSAFNGGGMDNDQSSSPTVTNCTFSGNYADGGGGGMMNDYISSPTVTNCTFSGNSANYGGGMYNSRSSSPIVTNCTFSGNSANNYGGGMYNSSSTAASPTMTNCVLWGDSPEEIYDPAFAVLSVAYSDIQGGYTGTGNINADPMFVDPDGPDNIPGNEDDDLHLMPGSPCIDTGTSSDAPATDLEGNPRPQGAGYDMGAYESPFAKPKAMPWIPLLLLGD